MSATINIDGQNIPLTWRYNKQAKRIILRFDATGQGLVVTLPPHAKPDDALAMAERNKVWIANHLPRHQSREEDAFCEGGQVLLRGESLKIAHSGQMRGLPYCEGQTVYVSGDKAFLTRRLTDWLKQQARQDIEQYAHPMAAQLGKTIRRIAIRDTVSRWGSCSSTGTLSFNWRLVMAPPKILHYVVAHEVAHLNHMNHGPDFWTCVTALGGDAKAGRHWLRKNGAALLRKGR